MTLSPSATLSSSSPSAAGHPKRRHSLWPPAPPLAARRLPRSSRPPRTAVPVTSPARTTGARATQRLTRVSCTEKAAGTPKPPNAAETRGHYVVAVGSSSTQRYGASRGTASASRFKAKSHT
ncbi:hypothetical protein MRX96_027848 [Rhipicephalus microplus]